jgi:CHAT domain-containing protein
MGHAEFDTELAIGRLILAGDDQRPLRLDADALAGLFAARLPNLVVLNACSSARSAPGGTAFSGLAAALFQAGVPAVVGMQEPVEDRSPAVFFRPPEAIPAPATPPTYRGPDAELSAG